MTIINASSSKCQMAFIMATQVSPCYETFKNVRRGLSKCHLGSFLDQTHKPRYGTRGSITGTKILHPTFLNQVVT